MVTTAMAVAGVLAQLVERLVRNEKVRGSNPLDSTSHRSFYFSSPSIFPILSVHVVIRCHLLFHEISE